MCIRQYLRIYSVEAWSSNSTVDLRVVGAYETNAWGYNRATQFPGDINTGT
jgi:hypothetical protein